MNNYLIRRATNNNDDQKLKSLYRAIFHPEDVGGMAEILYNHYPGLKKEYWYIAEDKSASTMVSALALIPWTWEINGIRLKVAEMGMVGTLDEHRGRGLQRLLNLEFDQTLQDEKYDLAVIQGIPGFYSKFGYHYAVALENHINLPLNAIQGQAGDGGFTFRLADKGDIPFLIKEDAAYRAHYLLSSLRNEEHWEYMLTHGLKTDCRAGYWIMNNSGTGEEYYFKIPWWGFGTGLIVSEVSEDMPLAALHGMLLFCRQKAAERDKPYIRFNLHNQSTVGEAIIASGIPQGKPYAWQVKIPDKLQFLTKLKPVLETRLGSSILSEYSGVFRLDFYGQTIDMIWENGRLSSVKAGGEEECTHTFCISDDLFPSLALGHHSWEELQYFRPEVSPELLNILPTAESLHDKTGLLTEILFPARKSWIYQSY